MRQADLLKALFESHLRGDDNVFREAAAGIIQEERKKRRVASANKLEQILLAVPASPKAPGFVSPPPTKADHALSRSRRKARPRRDNN
jgi:hypothetical protein